ncbi:MAG TPA: LppX_LprAFG lipoprotein [Mycobacterium sp.]|nr:LppX_LprAFG lipoprotein [Mycobacterium sp.]HNA50833.1 LppX_LprAFG lipoprotein [Mycobacterium sp.]HNF06942.1 LppX_LprAFG lipoprotein [Mycobacterium sp.]HNM12323.1 LppX_LprAFG lipoprotein [Mycobacterium sp.]
MQTCRRMFAVLVTLFATTALLLSGCSSSKPTEPLPDAAGLLQQAATTTKAVKSAHLELTINGKIEGLPVKKLSGDLTNVPAVAISGDSTITMGGSDIDIQLVVLGGTLYAALTPNNWLDMGPAADIYDPSLILNPDTGLANVLTSFSDGKSAASETINGIQTVRVDGKVSADAVNKIIPQLKATNPMPASVWIQKDEPHQLVQAKLNQTDNDSVQLTLSDWDKPVTVTKPAV